MSKYTLPFRFRTSIEIKDVTDYNDICQDILSDFIQELAKDERYLYGDTGYFNLKGNLLIERSMIRFTRLGEKIFPDPGDQQWFDFKPYNLLEE